MIIYTTYTPKLIKKFLVFYRIKHVISSLLYRRRLQVLIICSTSPGGVVGERRLACLSTNFPEASNSLTFFSKSDLTFGARAAATVDTPTDFLETSNSLILLESVHNNFNRVGSYEATHVDTFKIVSILIMKGNGASCIFATRMTILTTEI